MNKKYRVIAVFVVGILVGLLYMLARGMVDDGVTRDIISERELVDEEDEEKGSGGDTDTVLKREFEDIGDDKFQKVVTLFDTEDLGERQLDYLGDDLYKYNKALSEVQRSYSLVFSSIPDPEEDVDYSNYVQYEKAGVDIFSRDFTNGDTFVYISTYPTIIGMYGSHCVVYRLANMDEINLIVVDYENALLNTENTELFDFGQTKNLMIGPKYCNLVKRDGYKLLYMKEF